MTSDLLIQNVDMDMLQQQYVRLQEVIAFVEEIRVTKPGTPDASILDGIVEMLGDVLPIPEDTDDLCSGCGAHTNTEWCECAATPEEIQAGGTS